MKIPMFPCKYHQNGGFSRAMLVLGRVKLLQLYTLYYKKLRNQSHFTHHNAAKKNQPNQTLLFFLKVTMSIEMCFRQICYTVVFLDTFLNLKSLCIMCRYVFHMYMILYGVLTSTIMIYYAGYFSGSIFVHNTSTNQIWLSDSLKTIWMVQMPKVD